MEHPVKPIGMLAVLLASLVLVPVVLLAALITEVCVSMGYIEPIPPSSHDHQPFTKRVLCMWRDVLRNVPKTILP